jgi:peptidoglycan hydrolase-like protein with peptidoglycan-binding domain
MNNPVNMWDPTGHVPVPTWVGDDTNLDINGNMAIKHELLSSSSSNSGWYNIGTVDNGKEIIYKYQATITKTWVYKRYLGLYDERIDDFKFIFGHNVTYSQTDYYFDDVVVPASKIAEESEKAIQELVGNPPKNTDPPVISIRTKQVGKNPVQLMNDPEEIIVMNTGNNQTEAQSLITGAVQSELKAIMDIDLKASGVYGNSTEGAVTDFQEASNLLANGALTYETFYKIQNIYGQYKEITDKLNNLYNTDGASSSLTANLEKKLRELVAPYRNKGTGNGDSAIEKAILLTASFEGSGYVNVTGNFDGAGLSIGIFQWNIGQGTLQPMLKQFFDNNTDMAKQIFGSNYKSVVNMLSASKSAQMDWARSINNGKKLQTEWYNQFVALSNTSQFQQIQRGAMKEYTDQAYNIANTYGLKSERGLALALDIAVQNWDVSATSRANIKNSIKNGATEQQVLKLLAQAAVDKADSAYKADVWSRKFTIVNGTGIVHDTNYNLEKDYGITDAKFR